MSSTWFSIQSCSDALSFPFSSGCSYHIQSAVVNLIFTLIDWLSWLINSVHVQPISSSRSKSTVCQYTRKLVSIVSANIFIHRESVEDADAANESGIDDEPISDDRTFATQKVVYKIGEFLDLRMFYFFVSEAIWYSLSSFDTNTNKNKKFIVATMLRIRFFKLYLIKGNRWSWFPCNDIRHTRN